MESRKKEKEKKIMLTKQNLYLEWMKWKKEEKNENEEKN